MEQLSSAAEDQVTIARELNRLSMWARRGAPSQLSSSSMATLDTLEYAGPTRITDLATREGLSQPGMTTLINRLEGDSYAERFPDPTDGRAILVRITPAGRQVLAQRQAIRSAAIISAISRLPAEHQAALGAAVEALRALTQIPPNYEETSS
jgi:DNA-binding MarR family transcriptional regulator